MAFEKGSSSYENISVGGDQKFKNKLKALIVDDDIVCRRLVKVLLNCFDVENQEAETGKEAVDLYQDGAEFDFILMDREMPIMDGREATQILRSMGVRAKIIGMSDNSKVDEIQEFKDAGLDEFLEKPMTRAKLDPILDELRNNF